MKAITYSGGFYFMKFLRSSTVDSFNTNWWGKSITEALNHLGIFDYSEIQYIHLNICFKYKYWVSFNAYLILNPT